MDKQFHPEMRIQVENDGAPSGWIGDGGITLREHYAGQMMARLIEGPGDEVDELAYHAIKAADALIAALESAGGEGG